MPPLSVLGKAVLLKPEHRSCGFQSHTPLHVSFVSEGTENPSLHWREATFVTGQRRGKAAPFFTCDSQE